MQLLIAICVPCSQAISRCFIQNREDKRKKKEREASLERGLLNPRQPNATTNPPAMAPMNSSAKGPPAKAPVNSPVKGDFQQNPQQGGFGGPSQQQYGGQQQQQGGYGGPQQGGLQQNPQQGGFGGPSQQQYGGQATVNSTPNSPLKATVNPPALKPEPTRPVRTFDKRDLDDL